jgi:predicted RNase H-like HicB family nuclease
MATEMKTYVVLFERGPENWGAYVPISPGCVTTAASLAECRRLMAEAIPFHIEGMREHGEEVPEPSTIAEGIEVAA